MSSPNHRHRSLVAGQFSLPAAAIDEILQMARARRGNDAPSPRSVADIPSAFSDDDGDHNESAPCRFPDREVAHRAIGLCAKQFLIDVVQKSLTIMEYSQRATMHASDVEMALGLFVKHDANSYHSFPARSIEEDPEQANEDMEASNSNTEEDGDWKDEGDDEFGDGMMTVDYAEGNFDEAYPPTEKIRKLSDEMFFKELFDPIQQHDFRCCVQRQGGVDGILKGALYAFLVTKLS